MKIRHILCITFALLLTACVTTTAPDGVKTTSPDGPTVRAVSEALVSLFAPKAAPVVEIPIYRAK